MAEELMEALEAQHRSLQRLAQELGKALEAKDAALAGQKLSLVRKLLTAHIQLEETKFYPELFRRSATQPSLHATVELFQTNLKTIASGLGSFFERYEGKPMDLSSFGPAWKNTMQTLIARMEQEEERLHPLYRKLTNP